MKHRYNLNSSTNAYVSREKRGRFTHSLYSLLVLVLLLSGINLNAQTISLMVDQPIACNGNTDGSIQASTDLTGPNVAYSLNGGAYSNTSGFFNNLAPGTYTVCVSDDPSSISSIVVCDTISLIEPPAINISFVVDSLPGCTGGNLGGISAIITGGTILTWPGYYTYWYNSASTLLNPIPQNYDTWIQNLTPDVYTLTVEDEASCMATQSISLPELCLFIDQNVSCYGANDGTVQASTSAAGTWTYSRDGGLDPNTSGLFINLSVGQHTICMTDGSNTYCSTVTITQPDPLVVSISPDLLVSCYGNDGAITATVTGGTAILQPYQTTWQSGVTTSSIYDLSVSGLSVGTYTVTVEDDHACLATATYTLGANPPLSVTASAGTILCAGGTTTVSASPTGGSGIYSSVTISGGSWTVGAGTYTITVTDDRNCTATTEITPAVIPALGATLNIDVLPGCSGSTGTVSAVISGGTGPYTTAWTNSSMVLLNPSPNDHATSMSGLLSDTYQLTVTDANGCTYSTSIFVPDLCLFVDQNVSCHGADDGTVQASTSAAGSWTYYRDGGFDYNTSGLFINLTVGQHTICMTDGLNTYCSTVTITQPDPLVVTISADLLVSCYGNDGAITATVTGGTAILQPYQTTWQSGVTTSSIYDLSVSGLSVGTYTVTVEDDHACISTATYTLGANPPVSVTASAPVILCSGGTTTVTAVPTGGSGVFPSVTISGGSWVVGVGTYTITATDDRNCSATTVITTTQLPALGATLNIDVLPGCSGSTGTVSAVISGGTGPYTTAWTNSSMVLLNPSPNDHATSMSGLLSDTYQLTVTDANGCTYSTSIFVPDLCLFVDQNVSCHGADDGTVQASTSAAGSWTYYRDGGFDYNTSGLFINLTVGQHTICMTDGLNTYCSTVTITQPDPLVVTISADLLVSCYGNDGAITATVTGGTAILQPYQTTWQSGVTTSSIYDLSVSGLSVGTYTVTVEDDHACISTATYTLGANPPVSVTASAPVILCSGGTTTVTALPTGGSGVFPSVTISGGSWVVGVGTYTITATDDRNCSATTVITTTQLPALGATLNIDVLPGCSGSTGTVSATISGGTGPYTTAWTNSSMVLLNPSPNDHATSMSGLLSDTYQLTVTDANGCTYSTSIFVPDLCLFVDQNVSCHGADDGTVQASTSAAGSWTYYRDGGFDYNTSGLFINLTVGQHTICMTDGLNTYCSTVTITQPDPLVVTLTVDSTVSCLGNDGGLTATIIGGTAILQPYQTTWFSGVTTTSIYDLSVTGLTPGTYTVSVEDDHACISTATATVGLTPPVVVTASATTIICYGGTSVVSASASGGTGAISTAISGGSWTVTAGTYTITATDSKGCTGTTEITITEPAHLESSTPVTACDTYTWSINNQTYTTSGSHTEHFINGDGCDSTSTLVLTINYSTSSVANITAANSYTWNANGLNYTNSGTYYHTLTNAAGCDSNLTLNLSIITINLFIDQNVSCNGANDGTVIATGNGGSGNFAYDYDGGTAYTNTSGLVTGLTPGTHTICAMEIPSGVIVCDVVTITEPDPLVVILTVDSTVSCLGNDGALTATITGGTAILQPYLTLWSAGVTTYSPYDVSVTGLTPGTYTVTVEDDHSCLSTAIATVGLTPAVTVTASATPIACFGGSTTIIPSTSGGTGAISTSISGGNWTVVAGTYTITATDTKGCTGTTEITLAQPPYLPSTQSVTACDTYSWNVNNQSYTNSGVYTASFTSVNGCDSSFELHLTVNYSTSSVENVTIANSYTWAANGAVYTVSGTYYHTLTNAAGCDSSLTLNLTILNMTTYVDQQVSCNGNSDGSVQSAATGGSGNFEYDIDGANLFTNTTGWFAGLAPGVHTICARELPSLVQVCNTVVITQPAPISITLTVDSTVSCLGNDGGISAVITGGTTIIQPYLTVWSPAVTASSIYATSVTGLTPGTYTLTVEDDNLCFASASITVGLTPALTVSETHTTILCHGGTSTITPANTGGTGAIVNTITGGNWVVTAGTYTITATDSKGCTATTEVVVTEPPLYMYSQSADVCDTYTWGVNGATFTTSGVYTASYNSVNGCDSVYTLNLTIRYSTSSVENVTIANSYTWAANNATYTTSGTYYHTLTNAAGCDSSLTLNLTILNISMYVDQQVSCNGNSDGSVQANATGGSGMFEYDIDGANLFTNTNGWFAGLAPGTHTICARELPSLVQVCDVITVTQPAPISITLTVDSTVSCLGNDGGISAVITGGTTTIQPYLTTWSPGVTASSIYATSVNGLNPGTYTLTVEDDNLCFASATITLNASAPVTVTANAVPIFCHGQVTTINTVTSGGNGAITTSISGGNWTVGAGTYTITATDSKGCTGTTEITLTEPPVYTSTINVSACYYYTWSVNNQTYTVSGNYTESFVTPAGCDSTQTLILTINGTTYSSESITAANSYTWSANNVIYTTSGTYSATLVNANGCDSILTLDLQILNIDVLADQNVSCSGLTDGSAIATATGGSGNYLYDVDGANTYSNTDGIILNLSAGTHTICAKEIPSNVVVCGTVTILNANPINITLTVDSTVSCLGNDGGISAVVTGGTTINQPYLTTWASGVPTTSLYDLSVTGLTPGTYTLTVEDDNGCHESASIYVGLTPAVTVSETHTAIICYGGSSTITPSYGGGTGALSVSISGGNWTVGAGTYTITATDSKGCTATTEVVVTQPAELAYTQSATVCDKYDWLVNGATYTTSGTYTASYTSVNGCDSIYTLNLVVNYTTTSTENVTAANNYTWIANGATYTNSGIYHATLVNAANCDSLLTLNLQILNIDVLADQNVSCSGLTDGSAIATATGGSGNYLYDVDGANTYTNTDGIILNLSAGTHTICAKEIPSNVVVCGTVTILNANPISITLTVDSTVSCLGNDGGISAVVSGGTTINQPYLTTWASGVPTTSLYDLSVTGLTPGTYTLTVEDDNGCHESASIYVGLTPAVTVSETHTAIICYGGSSTITPSYGGGTGALSVSISGGNWTVGAGTYTITATDSKGCTATTEVVVTQPAELAYTQSATVCDKYDWLVNGATYTTSGTYTASYTSVNGCDSIYTLNLVVNYTTTSTENVTAANNYTWLANGATYSNSGTYTATLVGANSNGCDSIATLNLSIITIAAIIDQEVSCSGLSDGSILATATGGSGNFEYDIDGANSYTNTTGSFGGLSAGVHTVCARELPSNVVVCTTINVTAPNPISITLTVDSLVSCLGNDGGISAVVIGGTTINQPYLTTWASGVTTNSIYDLSVTGLIPGTYTLTVEDDNGCHESASITVGSYPSVYVSASANPIICNGGTTTITANGGGGAGAVTLSVSGGNWTVGAGTYTVTATDTKGCTATTELVITEPAAITSSESATACDSYKWTLNNQTYTVSGNYSITYTSVAGCDSVHTLHLTINYTTYSSESVTAANSYTWSVNGVNYSSSGTYSHTLSNSNNCDSILTLNLQIITISVVVDQNVSCNGNNDGSAQASAVGGTGNFVYDVDGANSWTNTNGQFGNLTPGTHTICAKEIPSNVIVCGTVTITQPAPLVVTLSVDSTVSCLGNDGGLTATISGGTAIAQPYLTYWSPAVTTNSIYDVSVTGLSAGTYTVMVEDDNLCFATATIVLGNTAPVTLTATFNPIACYGGTTMVHTSASGGTGVINTTISGGNWTVGAGTYTVTATDTKGCTATTVLNITEPAQIVTNLPMTVCDTYTWSSPGGNGATYTVSGNYPYLISGGAANGCDSLVILNLTVNYSNPHPTQFVVACDLFKWNVNQVTYTTTGVYTATYTNQGGCDSSYTLNVTINHTSYSTTTVTTGGSYLWDATGLTYTASGTYTATLVNMFNCDSILTLNLTIAGVTISPKAFLFGPYVATDNMMHDSLRSQGVLPNVEPYSAAPYSRPNILDTATAEHQMGAGVLGITGPGAIVDWVFVELRSGTNPSTIVATKRALIRRDGEIVSSVDGVSPLYFPQNAPGNYYVSIKHRNHLGVMTASALPLSLTSTPIDFRTTAPVYVHTAVPPISNPPRKIVGSVALLWAGDANTNKNVRYNGLNNDKEPILLAVGSGTPNNTVYGYRIEDVNMDGMVRYNNTDNDKNYILSNTVGVSIPNNVVYQHTPN